MCQVGISLIRRKNRNKFIMCNLFPCEINPRPTSDPRTVGWWPNFFKSFALFITRRVYIFPAQYRTYFFTYRSCQCTATFIVGSLNISLHPSAPTRMFWASWRFLLECHPRQQSHGAQNNICCVWKIKPAFLVTHICCYEMKHLATSWYSEPNMVKCYLHISDTIVNMLWAGGPGFDSWNGAEYLFSSSLYPDRLRGPLSILSVASWRKGISFDSARNWTSNPRSPFP
jgi:hypothetical protein